MATLLAYAVPVNGRDPSWIVASEALVADCWPVVVPRRPLDGNAGLLAIDRAQAVLGWRARRDWREYPAA